MRPSAVAAAASSYAARAASASSSVFSKAATAVAETATVATTAGAYATPGTDVGILGGLRRGILRGRVLSFRVLLR